MDKLRVAVLSLDHHYNALPFIASFQGSPWGELVAIWDADPGRAAPVAAKAGVPLADSWQSLLQRRDVDAVAVFASTDHNPVLCTAAARAGKHIYAIKPMARTLAEAEQVVQAVRAAGVRFFGNESARRLLPFFQGLKRDIAAGRFGRPLNFHIAQRASVPYRWEGDRGRGWWTDAARSPGGAWIDHSIYWIDLTRFLLGQEIVRITGVKATIQHRDLPPGMEDFGLAAAAFAEGQVALIEHTWTEPPGGGGTTFRMTAEKGVVVLEGLSGRVFDGQAWQSVSIDPKGASPIEHLARAVREGVALPASEEDSYRNLRYCLDFYAAAETL